MRRAVLLAVALLGPVTVADEAADKQAEIAKKEARIRRRIELKKGFTSAAKIVADKIEAFALQEIRVWPDSLADVLKEPKEALPDPLRYYMLDEDWEVQGFACRVAGRALVFEVLPALTEAYNEARYPIIRRMAVEAAAAFAKAKHAASADLLKAGLSDEEPGVRLLAVAGLEWLGDQASLRTAVKDKDHDTRYRAIAALARLGDEPSQKALFDEFRSYVGTKDLQRRPSLVTHDVGERYSQFLNAIALGYWGGEDGVKLLASALSRSKDYKNKLFLSIGSAAALGKATPEGKAKVLQDRAIRNAMSDGDAIVRAMGGFAAGLTGDKEYVRGLQRLLKDAQSDVRHNAVEALGHIEGVAAVKALTSVITSERDVPVRMAAVRGLSRHTEPEAVGGLARALRDKRYMVRASAARMLGRKEGAAASATKALVKAARDRDFGVREAAVVALARVGDPDGLPGIAGALKDRDLGVRIRALRALARFPHRAQVRENKEAMEKVAAILVSTRFVPERDAARECLVKVRSPHVVPLLVKELNHEKYSRRLAAFAVLKDYNGARSLDYAPSMQQGNKRREAMKRWAAWWKGGGTITPLPPPPTKRANQDILDFHRYARGLSWRGIDLVLAYDSTGSMLPVIRAVRQRLDILIEESARIVPNLRLSLFTYRDEGEEYVYYGTPLTYATQNLKAFVQVAEANRGGDLPEAVTATVKAAVERLDWRKDAQKVIIVIGDAPYHPENRPVLFNIVQKFGRKENRGTVHAIFTDPNRLGESIQARRARTKDGVTYPFLERLREMAAKAGGRAITIEDTEKLITEILILSFGEKWRNELESRLEFE